MTDSRADISGSLEHQAFLLALRERLRDEADTGVILAETSERLGRYFAASRTGYGEVDDSQDVFFPRNHWIDGDVVSIDAPIPFSVFGERITASLKRGEIWVHEDLDDAKLDDAGRETCRDLQIVAAITVPLMKNGRFVALLSVQQSTPRRWRGADVALIHEVAERTWAILERARADEARRASEAELERSREALYQSEKMTALGSLLAGVSHELNNPLSIIVAQAELLEIEAADTPAAARAGKVRSAATRAARIVQTFLAMARQKRPDRRPVALNEVVTAALELASYGLRTHGIIVRESLAPDLPPLMADPDQLHQVVVNLLVNAQQAMQSWAGERVVLVTTSVGEDDGTVCLTISDTGPGVAPEVRRRIFEPFFTTKPQEVGTGVGLSFSQGIVEAHRGTLAMVPSIEGATFRVSLPVGEVSPLRETHNVPAHLTRPRRGPRKALVADDEAEVAGSLADMLARLGFAVTSVASGAAAKSALAAGSYDLILSDIRMPDIDGPALFDWIATTRPDQLESVAFSTGDTLSSAAAEFLQAAQRPFMEKPFSLMDVSALVDQVEARR